MAHTTGDVCSGPIQFGANIQYILQFYQIL